MSAAPRILALDLASRTGCAIGNVGEKPMFSTIQFAREDDDHEDVFKRALQWIIEFMQVDKPDAVFVEAPLNFAGAGVTTNANTIIRLNGLWAVIAAAVKVRGIKYRLAKIHEIRKNFFGVGNLKGPEAKKRAMAMSLELGWSPKNLDEADSAALWFYAACREAPNLAPIITPAMHKRVASQVLGVELGADPAMLKLAGLRS
jgi:Holliday junction resolvasome RuvABC endonuclease subunit